MSHIPNFTSKLYVRNNIWTNFKWFSCKNWIKKKLSLQFTVEAIAEKYLALNLCVGDRNFKWDIIVPKISDIYKFFQQTMECTVINRKFPSFIGYIWRISAIKSENSNNSNKSLLENTQSSWELHFCS